GRPIGRDVNDLAEMIVQTLGDVPRRRIRAVPDGHEETAIRRNCDAASSLGSKPFGGHGWLGSKDYFRLAYGAFGFVQPRLRNIGVAIRAIDKIEKRKEDLMIRSEMGIEYHIEKADVFRAG